MRGFVAHSDFCEIPRASSLKAAVSEIARLRFEKLFGILNSKLP